MHPRHNQQEGQQPSLQKAPHLTVTEHGARNERRRLQSFKTCQQAQVPLDKVFKPKHAFNKLICAKKRSHKPLISARYPRAPLTSLEKAETAHNFFRDTHA